MLRLPAGLLGIAQHGHGLTPVEMGIAGGAVADAPAKKRVFSGQGLGGDYPGGQNDSGAFHHIVRGLDGEIVAHSVDRRDLLFCDGNVQTVQLHPVSIGQLRPGNVGQTRIVENGVRFFHLIA